MRSWIIAGLMAVGFCIAGFLSGCSRTADPPPAAGGAGGTGAAERGAPVAAQIGLGQFSGHTYTHDHFKLAVTLPDEWYIQKKSESDQLAQASEAVLKQNAQGQAVRQAAQQRTLTLVSAFRHPPGTPVPFNENLVILAENMAFLPGLKEGQDYLKLAEKSLAALSIKYEVEPIETGFKIGSHPAARLRVHLHVADKIVEQEQYAARFGDYFLLVLLSFGDDQQRDVLRGILESLKAD